MTQTPSNKNDKKNDPIIKGLEKVDNALKESAAKTVDFFDNTFLGDKRSLDEIKANREQIIQNSKGKIRELQDKYAETLGPVGDVSRGFFSIVPGLVNSTNNQIT